MEEAAGVVAEEDKPTSSVDDENTLPHGVEKIPGFFFRLPGIPLPITEIGYNDYLRPLHNNVTCHCEERKRRSNPEKP